MRWRWPPDNAAHHRVPRPRRRHGQALRLQQRPRRRQRGAGPLRRRLAQELAQRTPGDHRALQPRPIADRLIDRGQRPPQQDRPRDHDAGRHLAAQCQPRPQAQHHRLQEQAQGSGEHPVEAVAVGGGEGLVEQQVAQRAGASEHGVQHAEPLHGLAAGPHLLDEVGGIRGRLPGLLLERAGARLVDEGDRQQQTAGEHRQHAEHPVKGEQHEQEHRRPGRVEEGEGAGTGGEPLDRFQIVQAGRRPGALGRRYRAHHDRAQHARVEPHLQPRADTRQR